MLNDQRLTKKVDILINEKLEYVEGLLSWYCVLGNMKCCLPSGAPIRFSFQHLGFNYTRIEWRALAYTWKSVFRNLVLTWRILFCTCFDLQALVLSWISFCTCFDLQALVSFGYCFALVLTRKYQFCFGNCFALVLSYKYQLCFKLF